jgi:hypothetical protein
MVAACIKRKRIAALEKQNKKDVEPIVEAPKAVAPKAASTPKKTATRKKSLFGSAKTPTKKTSEG